MNANLLRCLVASANLGIISLVGCGPAQQCACKSSPATALRPVRQSSRSGPISPREPPKLPNLSPAVQQPSSGNPVTQETLATPPSSLTVVTETYLPASSYAMSSVSFPQVTTEMPRPTMLPPVSALPKTRESPPTVAAVSQPARPTAEKDLPLAPLKVTDEPAPVAPRIIVPPRPEPAPEKKTTAGTPVAPRLILPPQHVEMLIETPRVERTGPSTDGPVHDAAPADDHGPAGVGAADLERHIQTVCGKNAREVLVLPQGDGTQIVRITTSNKSLGKMLVERIRHVPGLSLPGVRVCIYVEP